MKRSFFIQLFYAIAETIAGGGSTEAAPLTSDKLTELKAKYATAWQEMVKMTDPFSKETKDAKLALWKIDGEIKAEEQNLQKAANDAKLAEMRNQRIQLRVAYKAAVLANTGKGANQATADAEKAAEEVLDNELLAKYAASKSSKPKADGETADSGKSSENKAAILELARAGKTQKEIIEAGYARSTVWHTINKAKIAGETFP